MATIEVTERFERGFSWGHAGNGLLECRSHALVDDDGGIWLIDPLDGDGLEEALDELGGEVVGVIVLLDRHFRASGPIAERHDVPVLVPPGRWGRAGVKLERAVTYGETVEGCPFTFVPLIERQGQWIEFALWWPSQELLVVPEAVGTAAYYRSRAKEPLAVHPVLRVIGPPNALAGLDIAPRRLLVGHGAGIGGEVATSLDLAVGEARRELPVYLLAMPRHIVKWGRAAIGMGRASC